MTTTKVFNVNDTYGVAVQPDGKAVVVGTSYGTATTPTSPVVAQILRYNTDGTLDATFDSDGIVTTQISVTSNFWDVVIQPDGKIIAGGSAMGNDANQNFAIARYNPNGTLDTSFGTNGIVITDLGTSGDTLTSIALASDGKIVAAGGNGVNGFITRYNQNGTLDTTFDGDGRANINRSGDTAVVIAPDSKILIGLNGSDPGNRIDFAVARLNANGSLDAAFDGDGFAQANFGYTLLGESHTTDVIRNIMLAPSGKIIAVGSVTTNQISGGRVPTHIGIARFNSTGSLDGTFGVGGLKTTGEDVPFFDVYEEAKAVALAPDGKIIVVGDYRNRSGQQDVLVLRVIGEGGMTNTARAKFDFDGDGKSDVSVFRPSNRAWYINQSQNGFTGVSFGASTDKIVPADYDGDGKTDVAVYRNGIWYLNRSQLGFTGASFGEATDKPVAADYDGDGKAGIAVFRPSTGTWYLQRSQLGFTGVQFGVSTDLATPGDYDGDGKTDIAVYRPSAGAWYLNRTQSGFTGVPFGISEDLPAPNAFVR